MVLPPKSFCFIRHGETDWNKFNVIQGQTDIPLNETGINQAHIAKDILKDIKIDNIYTSPLARAHHTASIINEELQKPLLRHNGLMERGFGESEGCPREEFVKSFNGKLPYQVLDDNIPRGAEQWSKFEKRVLSTFGEILEISCGRPLIVAHGYVFVALINALELTDLFSSNCKPFLFNPPANEGDKWGVLNLLEDNDNEK